MVLTRQQQVSLSGRISVIKVGENINQKFKRAFKFVVLFANCNSVSVQLTRLHGIYAAFIALLMVFFSGFGIVYKTTQHS